MPMAQQSSPSAGHPPASPRIPLPYIIFLLYIEPVATLLGFLFAFDGFGLQPSYMQLLMKDVSIDSSPSVRERIVLNQLGNLYLLFALNEALVLRATRDVRVWSVFLLGMLVADFGHLYSVHPLGAPLYWRFWTWNAMDWGNLGFVYIGATTRTCFLLGLGLDRTASTKLKK